MRRLIVVAFACSIACRSSSGPGDAAPLAGSYVLTAIDGTSLPVTVTMDGQATPVTAGGLSFPVPGFMTVNLTLGPSGESGGKAIALAGPYRRVTPDSVVFPSIAPPEVFVRRTAKSIVLVTQPAGAGVGPAVLLGGAHRFTFLQDP